jgi:RNA polymerase sigma factor (sigma-70 family)
MLSFSEELGRADKDIDGLVYQWVKDPYIQADGLLSYDDIKQEITIAFFDAYSNYNDEIECSFRTYYNEVIKNHMLNQVRSAKKCFSNGMVGLEDCHEEAFDTIGQADRDRDTVTILREVLSDRDFNIIKLAYGLDGCIETSQKEISKRLKVSQQTVSRVVAGLSTNLRLKTKLLLEV